MSIRLLKAKDSIKWASPIYTLDYSKPDTECVLYITLGDANDSFIFVDDEKNKYAPFGSLEELERAIDDMWDTPLPSMWYLYDSLLKAKFKPSPLRVFSIDTVGWIIDTTLHQLSGFQTKLAFYGLCDNFEPYYTIDSIPILTGTWQLKPEGD